MKRVSKNPILKLGMNSLRLVAVNNIDNISSIFSHEYAEVEVYEYPTFISLASIIVDYDFKRLGIGSSIVKCVIEYAEKIGKPIVLLASSPLGESPNWLYSFYLKLGFKYLLHKSIYPGNNMIYRPQIRRTSNVKS
jgi:predicted N-acetyltransferase YhbS